MTFCICNDFKVIKLIFITINHTSYYISETRYTHEMAMDKRNLTSMFLVHYFLVIHVLYSESKQK